MDPNPFVQFELWFEEAKEKVPEPEAMSLATASLQGVPSLRMVLLKRFGPEGFLFFTHSTSRKGREIAENPLAVLDFYWKKLERQVIIEGAVIKASSLDADEYFATRPRDSQIGAWASRQGSVLSSRKELLDAFETIKHKMEGKSIPRPSHWEGYWLKPARFEFWQGRKYRLHDRFSYRLKDGVWTIERLSP